MLETQKAKDKTGMGGYLMKQYDEIYNLLEQKAKQNEDVFASYDPLKDLFVDDYNTSIYDLINDDVNETMSKAGMTYRTREQEYNSLERAAKYQLTKISVDYDVCLINVILYGILCPYVGKERNIIEYAKNKYNWVGKSGSYAIRGDTMNSFKTPIIEYIRLFGDNHCTPTTLGVNRSGRNAGKFRVPLNDKYTCWYDFILENLDYFTNKILPAEAMRYIDNYHRIGNMIPIPFMAMNEEFNRPRGTGHTKDFWDLCLNELYLWFCSVRSQREDDTHLENIVGGSGNVNVLKNWLLKDFGGWTQFVEVNYLQDFCDEELHPIEYWSGHFNGDVMPKYINEFLQFFGNASLCIEKRSKRLSSVIFNKILMKDN